MAPLRVADVAAALESAAPSRWAAAWDNVGLLVGSPDARLRRCLVALDCDRRVVALAERLTAELIVCHHPVVFHPLRRLPPDDPAVLAARAGVAVYAAHTNLDAAPDGVSDWLAARLGITGTTILDPQEDRLYKLVTFVPPSAAAPLLDSLARAGAGRLGNYESCSFQTPGTGTFRPLPGAHPHIGTVGELARVDEVRVEVLVPEAARESVLAALRTEHPYEEPAFDLIALANRGQGRGLGRVGTLAPGPLPLADFARLTGERLGCASILRWAGDPTRSVARVACCGGAGAALWQAALAAGADAFVTGDVDYHDARAAETAALGVVDAGHFATEAPFVPAMAACLRAAFPEVLTVVEDDGATDVWQGV